MAFVSLPVVRHGSVDLVFDVAGRWWQHGDRRGRCRLSASISTRPQIERASAVPPSVVGGQPSQAGLARSKGTGGTGVTRRAEGGNGGPSRGRARGTDNPHSRRFVQKVCRVICVAHNSSSWYFEQGLRSAGG